MPNELIAIENPKIENLPFVLETALKGVFALQELLQDSDAGPQLSFYGFSVQIALNLEWLLSFTLGQEETNSAGTSFDSVEGS